MLTIIIVVIFAAYIMSGISATVQGTQILIRGKAVSFGGYTLLRGLVTLFVSFAFIYAFQSHIIDSSVTVFGAAAFGVLLTISFVTVEKRLKSKVRKE